MIIVDWDLLADSVITVSPINFISYFSVLKNVPAAGLAIMKFIKFMIDAHYVEGPKKIHLIGHSLGAHVIGSAGYLVHQKLGKKIGRITGLDPAGPFMKLLKPKDRLSKSKGIFVDALHTQIDFFGTGVALGHVDFYANGGKGISQPECYKNPDYLLDLTSE